MGISERAIADQIFLRMVVARMATPQHEQSHAVRFIVGAAPVTIVTLWGNCACGRSRCDHIHASAAVEEPLGDLHTSRLGETEAKPRQRVVSDHRGPRVVEPENSLRIASAGRKL
jgi:hypothetical protein